MRRAPTSPSKTKTSASPKPKPASTRKRKTADLTMSLDELRELETKAVRLENLATMLLNTPQQAFYLYDYDKQEFVLGQEHVSGLYGYKTGEIEKLKDGWFSIVHPDDLPEFQEMRRRMMDEDGGDDVRRMRMRVLRKQGGYEWVQSYTRPFERDAQGRMISEAGMVVVITPLVTAEEALRQAQARSHNLLQKNAAAVIAFDKKFNIVEANAAACRLLGYAKKALQRLSVQDLAASGLHTDLHRLLRAVKDPQKPSQVVELTLARQDAKPVGVLAASTSFYDAGGHFEEGVLILMDITKRQQEQEALKQQAMLNKIMLDHAPVAIGLLNKTGQILTINAESQRLFGFKQEDIKGQKVWKIPMLSATETSASRRRFEELLGGAKKTTATIPMQTSQGETRHVQVENTAVRTDDGVPYFISTGVDVTEQRKLESEVIRVAEQEHIRIGHDLHDGVGQTLTGVASLVEALVAGLEGQNKEDALRIHTLVQTAITETRRLSHGLSPVAVKYRGLACGLALIAETVEKNFRRECSCQIDESTMAVSQDSEIHLFRIAQEAINNAIRHGGATKMRISLRRKSSTQGVMEIGDNGGGFPAEKSDGTNEGIGLRVMEHRAHLIGGALNIQATKGRGVRVVCHFPLDHA